MFIKLNMKYKYLYNLHIIKTIKQHSHSISENVDFIFPFAINASAF